MLDMFSKNEDRSNTNDQKNNEQYNYNDNLFTNDLFLDIVLNVTDSQN